MQEGHQGSVKGHRVRTRVWRMCAQTWKREYFHGIQPADSPADEQRQHTLVQTVRQAAGGAEDGAI